MAAAQFRTLLRVLGEDSDGSIFKRTPTQHEVVKLIQGCECCPKEIRDRVEQIIEHPKTRGWALGECDKEIAALPAEIVGEALAGGDALVEELVNGTTLEPAAERSDSIVSESFVEALEDLEIGESGEIAELTLTVLKDFMPELVTAVVAAVTDAILPMLKDNREETVLTVNRELTGLDDFLKKTLPLIEEINAGRLPSEVPVVKPPVLAAVKDSVGVAEPAPKRRRTLQSIFQ